MDPIAIAQGVTGARHAFDLIKSLGETLRASGKSEALRQVLDLQVTMLDLVQKHHEQIQLTVELRDQVKQLEAELELSKNMIDERDAYWRTTDGKRDGPYCSVCFERDGKVCLTHVFDSCNAVVEDDVPVFIEIAKRREGALLWKSELIGCGYAISPAIPELNRKRKPFPQGRHQEVPCVHRSQGALKNVTNKWG